MADRLPFTDRNMAKALNDALERIATLEADKEANHAGWGKALETVAALTAALADDDTVDTRRLADRLDVWADTGQGGRLLAADTRIAAARLRELETANERMRSVSGAMRTLRSHIADYDQTTYVPLAAALDGFADAYPWDGGDDNG